MPLKYCQKSGADCGYSNLPFDQIWCCDFEFYASDGDPPTPVCMVAKELRSGRVLRLWQDELTSAGEAPFDTGPNTLFIAYYASAEIGCFLALGWPPPERILDLFVEFRAETNGFNTPPCERWPIAKPCPLVDSLSRVVRDPSLAERRFIPVFFKEWFAFLLEGASTFLLVFAAADTE